MFDTIIYGAGGLGKELFHLNSFAHKPIEKIVFYDDFKVIDEYCNCKVIKEINIDDKIFIGIANPFTKESIYKKFENLFVDFNIVSKDVALKDIIIGINNFIFQRVSFTKDILIGNFNLIHMNCTIGHDVIIQDFCSILPGVNISGNVKIGKATLIGSGAVILPGINIGKYCTIGAGAVVTKDIPDYSVAVGVPAKVIKKVEINE
ncbi:MAG: DapH/DapD/GlmU-related protein [Bacteroidia bacterium]